MRLTYQVEIGGAKFEVTSTEKHWCVRDKINFQSAFTLNEIFKSGKHDCNACHASDTQNPYVKTVHRGSSPKTGSPKPATIGVVDGRTSFVPATILFLHNVMTKKVALEEHKKDSKEADELSSWVLWNRMEKKGCSFDEDGSEEISFWQEIDQKDREPVSKEKIGEAWKEIKGKKMLVNEGKWFSKPKWVWFPDPAN